MGSNELISWLKKFTNQIMNGCGRTVCSNPYCGSNPLCEKVGESAAIALGIKIAKGDISSVKFCEEPPFFFTEEIIQNLLQDCVQIQNEIPLIHGIGRVFNIEALNLSFLKKGKDGIATHQSSGINNEALTSFYSVIEKFERVSNCLLNSIVNIGPSIRLDYNKFTSLDDLRFYIILLNYPKIQNPDLHRIFLYPLFYSISNLQSEFKDTLVTWISKLTHDAFRNIVYATQTFIARYVLEMPSNINGSDMIRSGTIFLDLLYKANKIGKYLQYNEFYNGVLNEMIEDSDSELIIQIYSEWKSPHHSGSFSVCNYPMILNPLVKSQLLLIDSHEQMIRKREEAFHLMIQGRFNTPYLVLHIHREHIIDTSLQQIEHILQDNKDDLKKKLIVKFVGEEGVDQGGPQKEFFQLIVKQLFNPQFGMFVELPETRNYWFSLSSQDKDEFKLIGVILGLAIYNGVILDIHFPFVVYKKLMSQPLTFHDLKDVYPSIWKGLNDLNNFEGNVEDNFGVTFQIAYEYFGERQFLDLVDNGGDVLVTQNNKHEYIHLYTNWLLEKSVNEQFEAFMEGFKCVCDGPFFDLFQVEEVELLICGETELNFEELEQHTTYDNGYAASDQVIRDFWEVVHSLSLEEKKKFLSFATGSDRSPIGGLKNLHLVITKHGEDNDRLPQSHTCFNVLLLPPYGSKEKVRDRLMTAIVNAEGFGLR